MERTWLAAALAALTIDVAACATHHGSSAPPASERAAVTVKNDNWSDVVVFVVRGGTRSRIGWRNIVSSTNLTPARPASA